jgi:hypothetical protein
VHDLRGLGEHGVMGTERKQMATKEARAKATRTPWLDARLPILIATSTTIGITTDCAP